MDQDDKSTQHEKACILEIIWGTLQSLLFESKVTLENNIFFSR